MSLPHTAAFGKFQSTLEEWIANVKKWKTYVIFDANKGTIYIREDKRDDSEEAGTA